MAPDAYKAHNYLKVRVNLHSVLNKCALKHLIVFKFVKVDLLRIINKNLTLAFFRLGCVFIDVHYKPRNETVSQFLLEIDNCKNTHTLITIQHRFKMKC